jgi:Uma2 family endonuclease
MTVAADVSAQSTSKDIQLRQAEKEYELVNGQLEEKLMGGARQSGITVKLVIRLGAYVEANQLGGVYGPDTTFTIGSNQRLPDVSFVVAARIPLEGEPEGIWNIAPDLAVEVISPTDFYEKVIGKLLEYFAADVQQVWLISSQHQMLTVYHSPTQATILTEQDELVADALIPGFRCQIAELFRQPFSHP